MAIFKSYEKGLKALLKQLGKNHPRLPQAQELGAELARLVDRAVRQGDDLSSFSSRAWVVFQLNQLALESTPKEAPKGFLQFCGIPQLADTDYARAYKISPLILGDAPDQNIPTVFFVEGPECFAEIIRKESWEVLVEFLWNGRVRGWLQTGHEKLLAAARHDAARRWQEAIDLAEKLTAPGPAVPDWITRSTALVELILKITPNYTAPNLQCDPAGVVDLGVIRVGERSEPHTLRLRNNGGGVLEGTVSPIHPALVVLGEPGFACVAKEFVEIQLACQLQDQHLLDEKPRLALQVHTNAGDCAVEVNYTPYAEKREIDPLILSETVRIRHPAEIAQLTGADWDLVVAYLWNGYLLAWLRKTVDDLKKQYEFEQAAQWQKYASEAEAIAAGPRPQPDDDISRDAGLIQLLKIDPDYRSPRAAVTPGEALEFGLVEAGKPSTTQIIQVDNIGQGLLQGVFIPLHPAVRLAQGGRFSRTAGNPARIPVHLQLEPSHIHGKPPEIAFRLHTNVGDTTLLVHYQITEVPYVIPPFEIAPELTIQSPTELGNLPVAAWERIKQCFQDDSLRDWVKKVSAELRQNYHFGQAAVWNNYLQALPSNGQIPTGEVEHSANVLDYLSRFTPGFKRPVLQYRPEQLEFGEVELGKPSRTLTIEIENNGQGVLEGIVECNSTTAVEIETPTIFACKPGERTSVHITLRLKMSDVNNPGRQIQVRIRTNDGTAELPVSYGLYLSLRQLGIIPFVRPGLYAYQLSDFQYCNVDEWRKGVRYFWGREFIPWLRENKLNLLKSNRQDLAREWDAYLQNAEEILGRGAGQPQDELAPGMGFAEFLQLAGVDTSHLEVVEGHELVFNELVTGQISEARPVLIKNTGQGLLEVIAEPLHPAVRITSERRLTCLAGQTARLELALQIETGHAHLNRIDAIQLRGSDGSLVRLTAFFSVRPGMAELPLFQLAAGIQARQPQDLALFAGNLWQPLLDYFWNEWILKWLQDGENRLLSAFQFDRAEVWSRYRRQAEEVKSRHTPPPRRGTLARSTGLVEFLSAIPAYQPPRAGNLPERIKAGPLELGKESPEQAIVITNEGGDLLEGVVEPTCPALLKAHSNLRFSCQRGQAFTFNFSLLLDEKLVAVPLPDLKLNILTNDGQIRDVTIEYQYPVQVETKPEQLVLTSSTQAGPFNLTFHNTGNNLLVGQVTTAVPWLRLEAEETLIRCEPGQDAIVEIYISPENLPKEPATVPEAVILTAPGGERFPISAQTPETLFQDGDLFQTVSAGSAAVLALAFLPDGRSLVVGRRDGTLDRWDADTGSLLRTFEGHHDSILAVAVHPQCPLLASGSADQTLRLWDLETGQSRQCYPGFSAAVVGTAFSPNGRLLACIDGSGLLQIRNAASLAVLRTLKGQLAAAHCLAFSPDSQKIATGSDGVIWIWDAETGWLLHRLPTHGSRISTVAFSPEGDLLASGGDGRQIQIWDLQTQRMTRTLNQANEETITALAFSPAGRLLASAAAEKTVRVWEQQSGQMVLPKPIEVGTAVNCLAYRPDGYVLACGCEDGKIQLRSVNGISNRMKRKGFGFVPNC